MISRRLLRIKAMQIYYSQLISGEADLKKALKDFYKSVDESYNLYFSLFCLMLKLRDYSEKKIEIRQKKQIPSESDLNPNKKFINNIILKQIYNNDTIKTYYNNSSYNWDDHQELISEMWKKIENSDYFNEYLNSDKNNLDTHKEILIQIITNEIVDNPKIDQIIEDDNIFWNDDLEFLLSIIIKNIKSTKKSYEEIEICSLYKSNEDKLFAQELLKGTILNTDKFDEIISEFLQKWDLQRVAFLDKVILHLSLCELLYMPEIPVKVAINEYLDIAKFYSTAKSNHFINGILDAVYNKQKEEGTLNKKGKGMIE